MPKLVWGSQMSVHIKVIDAQHQEILEALNVLDNAVQLGCEKGVLTSTFEALVKYVGAHFSTEEILMIRFSYPGYEMHTKEHRNCTSKVLEFWEEFNSGNKALPQELVAFLSSWLDNHMVNMDQQYSLYFKEKGFLSQISG
ncbi:MAG: hemerythrin family protein [Candidatus Omnitrophica bacterium]|nr:hemerythrin family protein [Candidatus Omnitrophota bacterium]